MQDPKKMAAMLMSKLENLDLDKVNGLQIGIMFDKPMKDDDDDDYHMMPDGTKMKGKTHEETEDTEEDMEDA